MHIEDICDIKDAKTPIIATAIHAGHGMRASLKSNSKLTSSQRLREEDPFTDMFAKAAETYVIAKNSRFEVDLNRPREKAVYRYPQDAWGLDMWNTELKDENIEYSLDQYDLFYASLKKMLDHYLTVHDKLIVLDIHSYNHRRNGPKAPFDDNEENPEINIGTGTIKNRAHWGQIIDTCIQSLSNHTVMGRFLDVRENVKFQGGQLASWIHTTYPESVCCLSIEFKKIFMNEWIGEADHKFLEDIHNMMKQTIKNLEKIMLPS